MRRRASRADLAARAGKQVIDRPAGINLPSVVRIRIVREPGGEPIADAVVCIRFAVGKSAYEIGPEITDTAGRLEFTRARIVREFRAHQRTWPMDYSGSIDDVTVAIVRLLDADGIRRLLDGQTTWKDVRWIRMRPTKLARLRRAVRAAPKPAVWRVRLREAVRRRTWELPLSTALPR